MDKVKNKIICTEPISNIEITKLLVAEPFDPLFDDFKEGDVYYISDYYVPNDEYYLIRIPGKNNRRVPKKFFLTVEEYRKRTISRIINEWQTMTNNDIISCIKTLTSKDLKIEYIPMDGVTKYTIDNVSMVISPKTFMEYNNCAFLYGYDVADAFILVLVNKFNLVVNDGQVWCSYIRELNY